MREQPWPRVIFDDALKQNARAEVEVTSSPDTGMSVSLFFPRAEAAR
ncbi:hypothetical protein GR204_11310 [Rhizobium leguminosarum]|uniref:Uncharacterized protein n=1 Tax=Rhizobium leguminosarum TaxID=384 RepID=A0A6P0B3V9_RHILE|nr:hypothetical protein [Rhizobium leguminosarum]NEI40943.1 hypothetical protein [Rhizobium leguminosarum]